MKLAINLITVIIITGFQVSHYGYAFAESKGTVLWVDIDFPPYIINSGPKKGMGISDRITKMVTDRLPQYNHKSVKTSVARMVFIMNNNENACFALAAYGKPVINWLSSIPTLISPPEELIINKKHFNQYKALMGKENTISIEKLFKTKPDLCLGIAIGRDTYGSPLLEDVLKKYIGLGFTELLQDKKAFEPMVKVQYRGGMDITAGLLNMLAIERIDYTMEYRHVAAFIVEQNGISDKIEYLPIKEQQGYESRACIACSVSQFSKQLLGEINAVLKEIRSTPEYREILRSYFITRGNSESFWKTFEHKVIKFDKKEYQEFNQLMGFVPEY